MDTVLANDLFLAWYYKEDAAKAEAWEQWLNQHPENATAVQEAIRFLDQLPLAEKALERHEVAAALGQLNARIEREGAAPVVPLGNAGRKRRWWMVAASAAVVFVLAALFWVNQSAPAMQDIAADYGQLQRRELSDGSVVTLNGNSMVRLGKEWGKNGRDREVWLNGEAFFKVAKTKSHDRFVVHTPQLDVIVTGTQFNVVNRGGKTSVYLQEGSVIVQSKDGKQTALVPGDYYEVGNTAEGYRLKKIDNAENIVAWTDKKMVFENTSMEELAVMVKDIYGAEVILADEKAKAIKLTGVMPNDNLDVLLQAIEASADCKITNEKNKITIRKK